MNYELATGTQTAEVAVNGAAMAGFGLIMFLVFAVFYVYFAYCMYKIAQKTNTDNPWLAWVPIVNVFYSVKIARVSMWWILGLLVPGLNIGVIVYVWMEISKLRNYPYWFGILMLISPVNLVIIWFLAFREHEQVSQSQPAVPATPTVPTAPTPPDSTPPSQSSM